MRSQQLNRLSAKLILALSLIALFTVLTGYFQPRQPDEGAAAHIFQFAILALVPILLLFFATTDWKQPARSARALLIPGASLILAFAALYFLEHHG